MPHLEAISYALLASFASVTLLLLCRLSCAGLGELALATERRSTHARSRVPLSRVPLPRTCVPALNVEEVSRPIFSPKKPKKEMRCLSVPQMATGYVVSVRASSWRMLFLLWTCADWLCRVTPPSCAGPSSGKRREMPCYNEHVRH
jgi:hypothetical protein